MSKKKLTLEQEQENAINKIVCGLGYEIPAFMKRDCAELIYYKINPFWVNGSQMYDNRIKLFENNYQMQRVSPEAQCIHQLLLVVTLMERELNDLKAQVDYIDRHYLEKKIEHYGGIDIVR